MATVKKSYGYARMGTVPHLPETHAKLCKACHKWFAAGRYQQRCENCLRPGNRSIRSSKLDLGNRTRSIQSRQDSAGQRRARGTVSDVRAAKRWAFRITERNVRLGLQGACDLERYR